MKKLFLFFVTTSLIPLTLNSMDKKELLLPRAERNQSVSSELSNQKNEQPELCPTPRREDESCCTSEKCVEACGVVMGLACIFCIFNR
jgi:hypothetical protein